MFSIFDCIRLYFHLQVRSKVMSVTRNT